MIDRKGFHHIYEYLELGYPYEEIEFMMEFIMKKLGIYVTEKDTLKKELSKGTVEQGKYPQTD